MAKILIIEDDTNINNMVSEYLSGNGYACTQAFSGSEGSLRFSMEEFDLILLDLMLPGMTGVFPKQKDIKKQPMFTCLQTKEYCY